MLKTGLHFMLSSLSVLTLWVLDVPFFSGAWVRCFCTTGFGCAALLLVGGYLWLQRTRTYHRHAHSLARGRTPIHWDDPEELAPAPVYHRR